MPMLWPGKGRNWGINVRGNDDRGKDVVPVKSLPEEKIYHSRAGLISAKFYSLRCLHKV